MKFEHLLKIYWSRGLYYNGKLHKLNWTIKEMFWYLEGLSIASRKNFTRRFELESYVSNLNNNQTILSTFSLDKRKTINMYFSQFINTNNNIFELIKFNVVRLYLIKSFRGRSQALGKPSRGQRTWSNAWTAYKSNKILKSFINSMRKNLKKNKKIEKINYKLIKKKFKKQVFRIKPLKTQIKKNIWF